MSAIMCPCCSKKKFKQCCEPFLTDKAYPKTPEQLMRSRYTAYSLGNIDYIEATMTGKAASMFDKMEAKLWSLRSKFYCLDVLKSSVKGDAGVVEFVALYKEQAKDRAMHEISQFKRIKGKWFYVDGSTT